MSTAATVFDRHQSDRIRVRRFGFTAGRILRSAGRVARALVDEIGRIPRYQDEAERLRQELRRR